MNPGGKLTLYEIAELAGVSKSSVSRVLMNQPGVSAETRQRILDIMKESGYRPSVVARKLAGGRSNLIGVITPGMYSGYYAEVLRGIDVVAHKRGVRIVMSIAHGWDDYLSVLRESVRPGHVDGVILVAPSLDLFRVPAPQSGVPAVVVSARAPGSRKGWGKVDSVTVDNEGAVEKAMDHLAEQGCRRIVHLAGVQSSYDARERRRGFENCCRRQPGIEGRVVLGGLTSPRAVGELMPHFKSARGRPDAVFAFNDDMAIATVKALRSEGLRVPDDVAVVGCDDEHAAEIMGLTTLHMPMVELGEEAAGLLFDRIEGKSLRVVARQSVLDMPLIVRSTSAREKKGP